MLDSDVKDSGFFSLGEELYDPNWTPKRKTLQSMQDQEAKDISDVLCPVNAGTRFLGERLYVTGTQEKALAPLVADALSWWRGTGAPPKRSEFDIIDHPSWAPNVYMVKCLSPGRFEYRLAGEAAIRLVGRNDAGRIFTTEDDVAYDRDFANYLAQVAESNKAWVCRGASRMETGLHVPFESVDLPLMGDSGQGDSGQGGSGQIGWILGVMEPILTEERWSVSAERQFGPVKD